MLKTVLTTALVLIGVGVGVYLVEHPQIFLSHADQSVVPANVKISNVSDNSFAVSWTTPSQSNGYVNYGTSADQLHQAQADDRDIGLKGQRYTHHVTVKYLNPATSYYFKIGSGDQLYDNNGQPYQQATASTSDAAPATPDLLFGKVSYKDNSVPSEALVYVTPPGGTLLSTYIKDDGNWLITLNNSRTTADLSKYVTVSNSGSLAVSVQAGALGQASQTVSASTRSQAVGLSLGDAPKPSEMSVVQANFGKSGNNVSGDLNHDGVVNIIDFSLAVKDSVTQ